MYPSPTSIYMEVVKICTLRTNYIVCTYLHGG